MNQQQNHALPKVVIILGIGLAVFLAVYGTLPSKILPENTLASDFSASRAMRHMEVIAAEPRPAGTEGNLRAREYILGQLDQMGLEPVIQSVTVCGHFPKSWCANPDNILVKIDGTDSADAILLVAHYDSQQFCPCASDDAFGVATLLETARAVLSGPELKNTVILLFTDAHEWNFQGAAAFVTQHPWAQQVRLVFAYDGSSSWGPASMVFYDPQTTWIIKELVHVGEYPFTSSMVQSFRDHPGGDLNAFQWQGLYGFESGFWPSAYYHSSLDTVENFRPAGMQQQGTIAVAMVRHFGNLKLDQKPEPFPVYFNLLRLAFVVYPVSWVLPIAGLIIIGFAVILLIGLKRGRLTLHGMGWSALTFVVGLIVSTLAAWLLFKVIPLINPLYETRYTANWEGLVYNQPWLASAFASIGIALTLTCFNLLQRSRKISLADWTMGILAIWMIVLAVVSFAAPGASYLLACPLLFSLAAPAYWLLTKRGMDQSISTLPLLGMLIAGSVAILLQVPMIMATYIVLSPAEVYLPTMLLVVTIGFLAPCMYLLTEQRRWWLPILTGLTALGILIPILPDGFDAKKPQYFDLYYVLDADQGKAVWASSTAPDEELFSLLFPQGVEEKTLPGFIIDSTMRVASAPLTPIPTPTVEVIKDMVTGNVRTMHLRFSSRREATILYVAVTNPNLTFQSVTVNGIVSAKPLNQSQLNEGKLILPEGVSLSDVMRSRTLFYFEGLGAGEVIDVVFEVIVGEPVNLIVLDSSFGLPESSQALLDALPLSIQLGHAETTVCTAVSFENSK